MRRNEPEKPYLIVHPDPAGVNTETAESMEFLRDNFPVTLAAIEAEAIASTVERLRGEVAGLEWCRGSWAFVAPQHVCTDMVGREPMPEDFRRAVLSLLDRLQGKS